MTTPAISTDRPDQALVHHFTPVFGHRPTPAELARYQRARLSLWTRLPARARRRLAQIIVKL